MASSREATLYEILGVDKKASDDEIKAAYKKLAVKHHPDKNNGSKESEKKFQEISNARDVLLDSEKRRAYDKTLTPPVNISTPTTKPETNPARNNDQSRYQARSYTYTDEDFFNWFYEKDSNEQEQSNFYNWYNTSSFANHKRHNQSNGKRPFASDTHTESQQREPYYFKEEKTNAAESYIGQLAKQMGVDKDYLYRCFLNINNDDKFKTILKLSQYLQNNLLDKHPRLVLGDVISLARNEVKGLKVAYDLIAAGKMTISEAKNLTQDERQIIKNGFYFGHGEYIMQQVMESLRQHRAKQAKETEEEAQTPPIYSAFRAATSSEKLNQGWGFPAANRWFQSFFGSTVAPRQWMQGYGVRLGNGNIASTNSDMNGIFVSDPIASKVLRRLTFDNYKISNIALLHDGNIIISSIDENADFRIYNVDTGKLLRQFTQMGPVTRLIISPDGNIITSNGNTLRFFDADSGALLNQMLVDLRRITAINVTPYHLIVSGVNEFFSEECFVYQHDLKLANYFKMRMLGNIQATVLIDNHTLGVIDTFSNVFLYNTANGSFINKFATGMNAIYCAHMLDDKLLIADSLGKIKAYNLYKTSHIYKANVINEFNTDEKNIRSGDILATLYTQLASQQKHAAPNMSA